jgi:hypothetical protein
VTKAKALLQLTYEEYIQLQSVKFTQYGNFLIKHTPNPRKEQSNNNSVDDNVLNERTLQQKYEDALIYLSTLKNGSNVIAKDCSLDNREELKIIINKLESDNYINKGMWTLDGNYFFKSLTFEGKSFLENIQNSFYKIQSENSDEPILTELNIPPLEFKNLPEGKLTFSTWQELQDWCRREQEEWAHWYDFMAEITSSDIKKAMNSQRHYIPIIIIRTQNILQEGIDERLKKRAIRNAEKDIKNLNNANPIVSYSKLGKTMIDAMDNNPDSAIEKYAKNFLNHLDSDKVPDDNVLYPKNDINPEIVDKKEDIEGIYLNKENKEKIINMIHEITPLFTEFVNAIESNDFNISDFTVLAPIDEHLNKLLDIFNADTKVEILKFFYQESKVFQINIELFKELAELEIYKITDVVSISNRINIMYNEVQDFFVNMINGGVKEISSRRIIIKDKYNIATGLTDNIFDKYENPVLNIKSVAKVFSKYIIKYNAESTSTIIGIFAKWGRGKTFFYELLKKEIKSKDINIYFCEFQPWKYQKQESAWAYLYGNILENYLNTIKYNSSTYQTCEKIKELEKMYGTNKKTTINKLKIFYNKKCILPVKLYFSKLIKIFNLNKNRNGLLKFILSIGSIIISIVFIVSSITNKFELINFFIATIGIPGVLYLFKLYRIYQKNENTVLELINYYGKTKDYSNYLGFQNEIERELKYLISSYMTRDNERLILFIDDLDRCNEKMIIDIMDSLRLVLEDEDINKKLTIITAVDERILLKSIKHKYFQPKDSNEVTYEVSPKEYIEKFFLIALKLNHLNDKDKSELVDEYTKVLNSASTDEIAEEPEEVAEEVAEEPEEVAEEPEEIAEEPEEVAEEPEEIAEEPEEIELKVLNMNEINFIKELVIQSDIDTPRKINMMIQRYLLFKNFIFEEFKNKNTYDYRLYILLIFHALDETKLEELISKYSTIEDEEIEIEGIKFTINRDVYIVLIKYAEMVSPF